MVEHFITCSYVTAWDQSILVNSFMSSGFFYHNSLDRSIFNSRVSGYFLLLLCIIEIPVVNANSVDPDQMPHSMASDQGLNCLPITILGLSRLKWVNSHVKKKNHFVPNQIIAKYVHKSI